MTTKLSMPELAAELEDLRARLAESEEVLRAIRDGDVDAVVVSGERGEQIYTLSGADRAYRQLIETMGEGAVNLSADGVILYCNACFAQMLGRPPDQLMGSALRDFLPPADAQTLDAILSEPPTAPSRREINLQASDGGPVPVYLSASRLQSEGAEMIFCLVLTDLTEQKSHEQIAAMERQARLVLEQVADAIIVCDERGRVVRASKVAERFCSGSPLSRPFAEAFALQTAASDAVDLAPILRGATRRNIEITLDRQGQQFDMLLNAGPLRDRQQILGCVITLTDITERKRAEEALRASQQIIKGILDAIPVRVFWKDKNLVYLGCNEAFARDAGYAVPEDIIGKDDYQMGWRDQAELYRGDDRQVIESGSSKLQVEEPSTTTDGNIITLLTSKVPLRSSKGEIIGVLGAYQDISEHKLAQNALRDSEDRYRDLVENSRDLICTHDLDGKLLSVNAAAVRITGYSREALLRMNMADLIVPSARDGFAAYLAEIRTAGKANGLMRICTASGERRWWEYANTLRTEGVSAPVVRGLAEDVTERLHATRDLANSEERFRSLVEQSIAGIYVIQDDKFVYVNPRCAEIFGYDYAEEMTGRGSLSQVAEKDREAVAEKIRQRVKGEVASGSYQFTGLRKDGSIIEIGVHGARATYKGQPAVIGMMQDISEKTRADEEIRNYVEQLKTAFMSSVKVATSLSDIRDPYTAGHERRVAEIAVAIGAELGFDAHRQDGLQVAGHLHDIGKVAVPAEILSKPGKLNLIELALIQRHAQVSYDVLKGVKFPWPVAEVALQHHERMDGSGYPQGLKGEAILLEARILAVADVVEAMSSHRPYRAGLGIDKALAEIERGRGTAYDPLVADACLRLFREKGYTLPA